MSSMHELPMPGGWSLSMLWLPMHGASWRSTALVFVRMWSVMMLPMMLPAAARALWEYRVSAPYRSARPLPTRVVHRELPWLAAVVGYAAVWCALGAAVFAAGATVVLLVRSAPRLANATPVLSAMLVVGCAAAQFTTWKGARLARCRHTRTLGVRPPSVARAVVDGVRLALDCCVSCANWMLILLVLGMMDPVAMVAVTAAITTERVPARGADARRVTGALAIAWGVVLLARQCVVG